MKRDVKIMNELYRRSFAASEPKGDWDELVANATIDDEGKKEIPFMEYECEAEVLEKILNDVMKEYKVPKIKRSQFAISFYLGCSPKTKM